ncbi:hypothetical protein OKA04_12700 [Luteolibacter flavescens]|uniref:Tyr recombinase domain-containing protein n=1 Tax=Luteolibacter flavescens TaxID=1859460 RepID=A0ABT3FPU2_9BACT|nr:hypothetical protein [Luteolibacter flavescens]MCW1885590.1 hypothetical protein [Luteolibacter flavescens]
METVTFGTAIVRIYGRSNGKWEVKWREAGRGRSTTKTNKEEALAVAKAQARKLDGASGKQWVTAGEADLLKKVKALAGERSPFMWLDKVEEAINASGGLSELHEAANSYALARAKEFVSRSFADLYDRLEDEYRSHRRSETWKTIRTELKPFRDEIGSLLVESISPENVAEWCGRGNPSPRTYNNRRSIWGTALGRARDLGWINLHARTAAEISPKRREAKKSPTVWSPQNGRQILALLREKHPDLVAYFALQCWGGLRPSEAQDIEWRDIGEPSGYIHVRHEVAGKLSAERFAPIQSNLKAILESLPDIENRHSEGRSVYHRRRDIARLATFPAPLNAATRLAEAVIASGVVNKWPNDVCRHSFCTYRLASTKAIGAVAEEAGNSEAVIRNNYRKPVPKEMGEEWFEIL